MAWHRPTLALSQEVDFPSETRMRHAPAGAPRRELSKSVEFLKIGSLDQMLWLRDADRSYPVHCDNYSRKPDKPPPGLIRASTRSSEPNLKNSTVFELSRHAGAAVSCRMHDSMYFFGRPVGPSPGPSGSEAASSVLPPTGTNDSTLNRQGSGDPGPFRGRRCAEMCY